MSDVPQTLSLVVLAQMYRGDIVAQVNRRARGLSLIKIVPGEGKNCAFVAQSTGQLAENYSEGADASNFGSDAQTSCTLSWSQYRSNFHVSGLAMAASRSSQSPLGNVALWAKNMIDGAGILASKLNQELYAGAGTGTLMAGLDVAIGSTSNTYAGIDRGSNSFWRPIVVDPGSPTAPTLALIRDDMRQIFEAAGENPDVALCSPAVFNKVASLFDTNRRYVQVVNTARGAIQLSAGADAIDFDGCVFVKDKDATANTIYYLNTNHVRLEYLAPDTSGMDFGVMGIQADDGFGKVPLGFQYELLAKAGDSKKAMIKAYTQLVVDRPNSCGVRLNVSTS